MSEVQARDGAGLTSTIGVAHRGHGDSAVSIDPRITTAHRADIPAVSRAAART